MLSLKSLTQIAMRSTLQKIGTVPDTVIPTLGSKLSPFEGSSGFQFTVR